MGWPMANKWPRPCLAVGSPSTHGGANCSSPPGAAAPWPDIYEAEVPLTLAFLPLFLPFCILLPHRCAMAPSSTAASSNTHLTKSNKSSAFELREIGDDGHQRHAQDASNDSAGASTSSHRLSHVDQSSEYLQGPGLTPPESLADRNESQLPPVDGGKDAWLFLAACFLIEALVWGA